MRLKVYLGLSALAVSGIACAEALTLDEAVRLATRRNGTLRAAMSDIRASHQRVIQSRAAFMPTLSPSVLYTNSRREIANGQFGNQGVDFEQTSSQASLAWQILDSGQRLNQLRQARESEGAIASQARQTARNILFSVESQFLESLRSSDLERVASSQFSRSQAVLAQTKERALRGDVARREILQSEADALNTQVSLITAQNRTQTNLASLKAIVGMDVVGSKLELQREEFTPDSDMPASIESAVQMGIKLRPDLVAGRRNIEIQRLSVAGARIESGLTYSATASYDRQFSPNISSNQLFSASLTYPLFDAGLRRAIVAERKATLDSTVFSFEQSERDARSEIEAAFITYGQNKSRVESADLALKAAQLNFDAATESRRQGVANLIDVITAQVSLVTAELNRVESVYDLMISSVRLRLVSGLPMRGEEQL